MINKKVIQNKGITLIALVITIVVLLILAGITISNIVGKNGILNKANSAVTETEKGEIKEQLSLSLTKLDILASKNNKGIKEYCENKEAFIENSTWNNNIYNISEYSLIDDTISLKINKTSGSKKTYSYKIDINSQVIEEIETDNEEPVPNPTQKPTPTQEPTPTPEPATSSEYFSWEVSDNIATLTGLTEAGITAYNNKEQNIINLVIPSEYNGVQDIKIGAHVFENKEFIEKVVLGDNVIAVGYGAFYNCTGIKELQIPISIDSEKNDGIAANVPFEKCANIEKISFTKGKTGKGFDYSYSDNTYNWTPWYKSRDNLKEIEFEEGVEYIGAYMFYGFENISMPKFPTTLTEVGEKAFYNCKKIEGELTLAKQLTSIGESAFESCTGISGTLELANAEVDIGKYSFYGCTGINKVIIKDETTGIKYGAFNGCTGIKELQIPISIDSEDNNGSQTSVPFIKCTNIEKVTFTKGTTGEGFNYTTSTYNWTPWYLSRENALSIYISKEIKSIGTYTFKNLSNAKFYYEGSQEEWNNVTKGSNNDSLVQIEEYNVAL